MKQIEVQYIRSDKTIEKYISNNGKPVFIYNNQCLYFDVFYSEEKLNAFLENKICRGELFFGTEESLNKYFGFN